MAGRCNGYRSLGDVIVNALFVYLGGGFGKGRGIPELVGVSLSEFFNPCTPCESFRAGENVEAADAEKPHPSESIVAMMPANKRGRRGSEILMM